MGSVGKWDLSSPGDGPFRASVFYMGESYIASNAIAHEFGHNLGIPHASSLSCVPVSLMDPADSGRWIDAGDTADTMGSISSFQHFSSAIKSQCSWFDPLQVQDLTVSGEFTLDQLELPSNGVKALRIPLGKDSAGGETHYWVDYRTPGTFDKEQGVQVRYQPKAAFNGSSMNSGSLRFTGPALSGGGSISGKVVRASDGSAVPQAYVYLYGTSWNYISVVVTDSSGRYAFKELTAGNYYLRATNSEGLIHEYYNDSLTQKTASAVAVTQDRETPNIHFVLTPGSVVSGVITSETDGQPIPSTSVYAYDSSWNSVGNGYTDSSGRYYIPGLPAGLYNLQAYNSSSVGYGYVSTYYINTRDRTSATSISLGTLDRLNNVDFSMPPGGAISGQVVRDSDKTPIQSVSVYAYDRSWTYIRSASTGIDGRYIIRNMPSGSYFVGTVNGQGYINEYYRDVTARETATTMEVVQGSETRGIDFSLARPGATSPESHDILSASGNLVANPDLSPNPGVSGPAEGKIHPLQSKSMVSPPASFAAQEGDARVQLSDVTATKPFVDPYRGVKIELLESTGVRRRCAREGEDYPLPTADRCCARPRFRSTPDRRHAGEGTDDYQPIHHGCHDWRAEHPGKKCQ